MSERKRTDVITAAKNALAGLPLPGARKSPPKITEIQHDGVISWLAGALPDGSLCVPLLPFDRKGLSGGALAGIEIPYINGDTHTVPALFMRPDSTEFSYFLWRLRQDTLTDLPLEFAYRVKIGHIARRRADLWVQMARTRLTLLGHSPPDLGEIEDTMRSYAASLDYPAWLQEAVLVHLADQHGVPGLA